MDRSGLLALMNEQLERQGKRPVSNEDEELLGIGFRSLDFSELALRVEDETGTELNFDAPALRAIETVKDVLDFFLAAV